MLFSLAGIPLTAGFLAKFYVLAAGASAALWVLVIVLVVSSAIGLFYYLRVIAALYAAADDEKEVEIAARLSAADGFVLATLTFLLFWFGVYPAPLLRLIGSLRPS
jgi:NADH-quinone oxidoreductase subunit N